MLFILKSANNTEVYKVKTESSLQRWFIPFPTESRRSQCFLFILPDLGLFPTTCSSPYIVSWRCFNISTYRENLLFHSISQKRCTIIYFLIGYLVCFQCFIYKNRLTNFYTHISAHR